MEGLLGSESYDGRGVLRRCEHICVWGGSIRGKEWAISLYVSSLFLFCLYDRPWEEEEQGCCLSFRFSSARNLGLDDCPLASDARREKYFG